MRGWESMKGVMVSFLRWQKCSKVGWCCWLHTCEYTKDQWIVHLKQVNCMVYKIIITRKLVFFFFSSSVSEVCFGTGVCVVVTGSLPIHKGPRPRHTCTPEKPALVQTAALDHSLNPCLMGKHVRSEVRKLGTPWPSLLPGRQLPVQTGVQGLEGVTGPRPVGGPGVTGPVVTPHAPSKRPLPVAQPPRGLNQIPTRGVARPQLTSRRPRCECPGGWRRWERWGDRPRAPR